MESIIGKKLLILAGADVHVKVVRAAKELEAYTIVTDNLAPEDSPAKLVVDEYWNYSITAVDEITRRCREDNVNGVLNFCIDPVQIPYQQICESLHLPCYGTREQFKLLTDKRLFKDYCVSSGVGLYPEYSEDDIETGTILSYLGKADDTEHGHILRGGFFQGFYGGGREYMYDPGVRFPGSAFDVVLNKVTGFDSVKAFVHYALTGDVNSCVGDIGTAFNYAGGHCLILALAALQGKIATIKGVDEVATHPYVFSAHMRRKVGDLIENRGDVTRRVVEFCAYIPKGRSIRGFTDYVYHTVQIKDENGENMIISKVAIKDSDYQC